MELLNVMEQLDMILNVTHLNDDAFWHALDIFKGTIWDNHNNCRVFVDHNRQFSDEMIRELIDRKAGIGSDLDGGYGTEQCPFDLNTIADLEKLPDILRNRGFTSTDVENVMYLNFVRYLKRYFDNLRLRQYGK